MSSELKGGYREAYRGGRMTAPRKQIVSAIVRLNGAFTVDQLFAEVRCADPAIGLATVYRAVGALCESGWLERIGDKAGSTLFSQCAEDGHHHHIVCERCGTTALAGCDLEQQLQAVAAAQGFTLTRHEVVAYGLCDKCGPGAD